MTEPGSDAASEGNDGRVDIRPWNWRTRARDPRFAGLVALILCVGGGILILQRHDLSAAAGGVAFAMVVAVPLGLLSLPPWRDPRHPPSAGAFVLAGGGLLVLAVCAGVGFGLGVS